MSESETTQKVVTGDLGKAIKPVAMTPLNEGVKPVAMTPTVRQAIQTTDALPVVAMTPLANHENRGLSPAKMTPVQPSQPQPAQPAPAQPAQTPKK